MSEFRPDPNYHWLECDNCGHRIFVVKGLTGIFCNQCKKGTLRVRG